jgi:hypothetical protein
MNTRILTVVVLALLSGCGQEEPARQQGKSIGGQIGDSYKGMLDGARQSAEQANDQMQRSEQSVRELNM